MRLRLAGSIGFAFLAACGGSGSTASTGAGGATPTSASSSGTGGSIATSTGGAGGAIAGTSSASTSAGTGGSGGGEMDAGIDAPMSACAGLAYCDDFESYMGDVKNAAMLGPWKASVAGATMVVDTMKPHGGLKSLHITVPMGAAAHGTLNQTVPAGLVAGNNLFGRAMIFYSNTGGNGLPLGVHSWLFNSAGNSTAANGKVTMNLGGGGAKLQINYHPPAPATEQSVQGGTMTAGVWHCVQWQYDGSGTPPKDDAKVWVDGALAVEAMPSKKWDLATPWTSMDFGFTHYQTLANGVDIYLDDFAVDGAKIDCPAP